MRIQLSGSSLAFVLVGALFAGLPSTGVAQVVNPTIAEFTPSPDHSRLASDGTAWVTRYDVGFYQQGASSAFQVASLGKPAPAADGQIRFSLSTLTLPAAGIVYEARVIAVGPGGSTPSAASNTFMFAAPCTYAVTPPSHTITAGAWSGTVDVSAGTSCQWTAVSNHPAWLGFNGGAASIGGTGGARVSIHALANTSTSERTGTFTIAGHAVTIRQAGVACTFSVSPTSLSAQATGGTLSVRVTAPAGCSWTASASGWLTVSPTSGSGDTTVSVGVAANTTTSQRTASVTVAGQAVSITQSGAAPCAFSLNQTAPSFSAAGGQGSLSVTTGSTCTWSASAGSGWITVASTSRTGSGSVSYSVAPNPLGTPRVGTLTVAGQSVRIDQEGASCRHTVSPTALSAASQGGNGSVQVSGPDGCQWSASTNGFSWITITSGASGTVSGAVNFSIAPNPLSTSRTGSLAVAGQTVTVQQAPLVTPSCTYAVSPIAHAASASGGAMRVDVVAPTGCAWSASSLASWLTITAGSVGTGRASISFAVAANPLTTSRTGTLSVAGETVTVTQAAAACRYVVTPTSHTIAAGGGTALGQVTTTSGCAWTTENTASWLTVSRGRSETGDYTLTATPNTSTSPRSAVVTIAGTSVSVTQSAGATCQVSVSSSSMTVGASGLNNASVQITAGSGCAWTASSGASWLVVRNGSSGSGNGAVTLSVDANTTGSSRTTTLTIGGQEVTISQEASTLPKGPKGIRIISTR